MNWDDLRVVRAVYQGGSFAAAARSLRVNETTVARRLGRIQRDLGMSLFDAVDGGRRPTARCIEVIALAEQVSHQMDRIERIADADPGPLERRRIAATDSITTQMLVPNTVAFLAANPGLALDLLVSTANVEFSRWQADLAIRLQRPEKGDFVISKLASFELNLVEPATPATAPGHLVLAYPDDLDLTPESKYLAKIGLLHQARCRSKNLLILKQLLRSGECRGVLPAYLCADLIHDRRLRFSKLPQRRDVWLLVQRHLKDDPATRQVIDWIRDCFSTHGGGNGDPPISASP